MDPRHWNGRARLSNVRRFGAEQEHGNELDHEEDLEQVEEPQPAETGENLPADDRSQTGAGIEDEVDKGHTLAALVHEVEVADAGYNQRLKGACRKALNDTSGEKMIVVNLGFANGGPDYADGGGEQEHWSFSEFGGKSGNKGAD